MAVTASAALAVARSMQPLDETVTRLQDTTAEIRVRAAVVLLVGFVALAAQLGLETILGAFLAGAVVGLVDRDTTSHPHFRTKLEAIGYGFLIPVFFVASGLRLDLGGLIDEPVGAGPGAGPGGRAARRPRRDRRCCSPRRTTGGPSWRPGCSRRRRCRSS